MAARPSVQLETFTRWLTEFGDSWERADPDGMAALFTVGATLQPTPFGELVRGRRAIRDHLDELVAGAREIQFRAQVLGVGDTYAVAHWRVSYRPTLGEFASVAAPVRLRDGILLCALDARGRCTSLRQWWHETAEPAPGVA